MRDDLDAMVHLDETCFDEAFRFSKSAMRRFAEIKKAQVLIAESATTLAGFSIVHVERSRGGLVGYLVTLDVAHEFRRRGLARHLLLQAECNAAQVGCSAMLLHVFTENTGAIALYEKLGYCRERLANNFYSVGLDALVYRKPLS